MEYIESIGFTPKILKIFFAQIMFFTDKKSQNVKKAKKNFPSVTRRRRRRPPPLTEICATPTA
jgi:hypothetical protein